MANTKKAVAKKANPKRETKKDIMKQLGDPSISKAKKNQLMERLYKGIDIK